MVVGCFLDVIFSWEIGLLCQIQSSPKYEGANILHFYEKHRVEMIKNLRTSE
jgi:hypothetical protein